MFLRIDARRWLLLVALMSAGLTVHARCPVLDDLSWQPTTPSSGDEVTFRLWMIAAVFVNFSASIEGSTILLSGASTSMMGPLPSQYRDISVGPLTPGTYTLRLDMLWINQIPATVCPTVVTDLVVGGGPGAQFHPVPAGRGYGVLLLIIALLAIGFRQVRRAGAAGP